MPLKVKRMGNELWRARPKKNIFFSLYLPFFFLGGRFHAGKKKPIVEEKLEMLAALWPAVPHWNAAASPPSLNRTLLWSYENATAAHLWRMSRWSMLLYAWDVGQVVQDAVAAWAENSDVRIRYASGPQDADVVVSVEALPRHVIASTRRIGAGRARVVLSASKCWFLHDARACRAMREHRLGVLVGIGSPSVAPGAPRSCTRRSASPRLGRLRRRPLRRGLRRPVLCVPQPVHHNCARVRARARAEPRRRRGRRGCARARAAGRRAAGASRDGLGVERFRRLQRDDVDAVRTMHGGESALHPWYAGPPALLTAHAGLAALYALVLSGALRACRRVALGPRKDLP